MDEYKKGPKSNADTLCKTQAKGGGNGYIRPRGGRRGGLVEPGWEVAHSLCWILLVIGVRQTGRLLQPPSLTLSSTIVIFLINTELIFPPPSILPPTVVLQLVLIAVIRPAHPSIHHLPLLQPRKLWQNVEGAVPPPRSRRARLRSHCPPPT